MTVPMTLLALLEERPRHGFALKRRWDELLGRGRELRYGQVYATLARLERDGLAREVGIEPGEGADRKVYAVTDRGVAELEDWLAHPHLEADRPGELFTRVVVALLAGRPAEQILDTHRALALGRMRELTAARRAGDAVDRLAADWEIAHLEADLQWIELAAARLEPVAAGVRLGGPGAPTAGGAAGPSVAHSPHAGPSTPAR